MSSDFRKKLREIARRRAEGLPPLVDYTGGTIPLGDLNPGAASSHPRSMFASGSRYVWFGADDGQHGRELWRTDGTAAGTVRISDIDPAGGSSDPEPLAAIGGNLLFAATDPSVGREPFYVAAGATTVIHGVGCSGDALVPTLAMDDLVLGGLFQIRIGNLRHVFRRSPGGGNLSLDYTVPFPTGRAASHPFDELFAALAAHKNDIGLQRKLSS